MKALISNRAILVKEIIVIDPSTQEEVEVEIYWHENSGAMFGVDSSYVAQVLGDEDDEDSGKFIPDPFAGDVFLRLDLIDEEYDRLEALKETEE